MKFVKMHGIRNDYVYLDAASDRALGERLDRPGWDELVRRMSDRHSGIGSDGVIVLCPASVGGASVGADVRMRMFNADGSESQMCGNGIRCVAKFAHDRLGIRTEPMRVETGRGVLEIRYRKDAQGKVNEATVDMGEPILEAARVPVAAELTRAGGGGAGSGGVIDVEAAKFIRFDDLVRGVERGWMERSGLDARMTCVSMGNPHVVFFCRDVEAVPLEAVGPFIETQRMFPERINVHFVAVAGSRHGSQSRPVAPSGGATEARMRTWERGAGATLACGTGACASLVAGALTGRLSREALMHLPGGDLRIRWDERTNHVFMTGPAEDVFEGEWKEEETAGVVRIEGAVGRVGRPRRETERLVLRPFEMSDAQRVAELAGDRAIAATTLLVPHPYKIEDAERWIASHAEQFAKTGAVNFAVCLKRGAGNNGELVGAIGLRVERDHARGEIGYWIGTPYWNRGYATEASRGVIDYAFEEAGLSRVFAYHYRSNPASGRVLAKAGMRPEGCSRSHVVKWGVPQDCEWFAVLKSDWTGATLLGKSAIGGLSTSGVRGAPGPRTGGQAASGTSDR